MTEKIKDFVEHELKMLDRGIVATPKEEVLDMFAQANHGTNDFLLMQMAKNYGYKLALENVADEIQFHHAFLRREICQMKAITSQ